MHTRAAVLLAAFVAATAPLAAAAQTAGAFMSNPSFQDPPPKRCDSTVDMQHCAASDLRKADAAMAMAYKDAAGASTDKGAKDKLLAAQRSWLAFRDEECLWQGSVSGGSMAPVVVAQCWVEVTKARREQLKTALQP